MGRKIIIWFVIFTVLLLIVPFFWGTYNRLIKREENVKMAWSQVENQYQRQADLIMNLVETVKGYASHEQETFRQVIEARATATNTNIESDQLNAENLQQFSEKQAELSYALSRLIMIVENYPDLKANENFIMLQGQLEGTENRIGVERKRFNETVRVYNTYRRRFPKNLVVGLFGFEKQDYFESAPDSDTKPDVKF